MPRGNEANVPFVVVIGSGSIAACNLAGLVNILRNQLGGQVSVVLTSKACQFITAESLLFAGGALAVLTDDSPHLSDQPNHIFLATRACGVLVYPASADFLAKMAAGLATDLASTTFLTAHEKPRMVVPSMNPMMWSNPLVQRNIDCLRHFRIEVLPAEQGTAPDVDVISSEFCRILGIK